MLVKFLLQDPECYKDTQIKGHDITKLIAELKATTHSTERKPFILRLLLLFRCRRSIATGSSALTIYLDLLGVGKLWKLRGRKQLLSHSRSFKVIWN